MRKTFLKIRDPSIIAYNIASNEEKKDEKLLKVYLRIKGGTDTHNELYDVKDSETLISKIPEGSNVVRNIKHGELVTRKYNFSKIFGPEINQNILFDELVRPKLFKFLGGHNSTLMSYGVSGSGKTYTIVGTDQDPGIVPRTLEYLFESLPNLSNPPKVKPLPNGEAKFLTTHAVSEEMKLKETMLNINNTNSDYNKHHQTYRSMQSRLSEDGISLDIENSKAINTSIWISFIEIYNEHIYDLLKTDRSDKKIDKLKLGNSNGQTYVKNISYINVSSGLEAYQLLQYGLRKLNYAQTGINHHSSRSHAIFTLTLTQERNNDYCVSRFNFCDLAGAERSKKTLNINERLKESNNINTSLLVLGRCIHGIRNSQKDDRKMLIPFRESKLTQIFQHALSGFEEIGMVVNINPSRYFFDETQHVLNFSAIAKEIIVICQPKKIVRKSDCFDQLIQGSNSVISEEDESLHLELEELKNKLSEMIRNFQEDELQANVEEDEMRSKLITKYKNSEEKKSEKQNNELIEFERSIKNKMKQRIKAAKLENMESMREIFGDISSSTDSSDDEIFNLNKKRKHSSDIETIVLTSSDEDDDDDDEYSLEENNAKLVQEIDEYYETIHTLEKEISDLKSIYEKKIEEREKCSNKIE